MSEVFENLVKQAENYTSTLFTSAYRSLAPDAGGPVRQLFGDISLLALGSELEVEDVVRSFFEQLFPVVYRRVIDPDATAFGEDFAECLRVAGNRLGPFGGLPKQLARRLGRSVPPAQVFLQALHLGIEVINTTDHLQYTKECRRALLKMLYCPHCQGLTRSKPCTGYCLNVMRGCLASVAEVDAHWREFVRSLEDVSAGMQEHLDLEQALFGVRPLVAEALAHAQNNGPKLSAQNSIPLKAPERSAEETFSSRRREFINSLRLHRTFYGGLADQLCVGEVASEDGLSCWNGADVTKRWHREDDESPSGEEKTAPDQGQVKLPLPEEVLLFGPAALCHWPSLERLCWLAALCKNSVTLCGNQSDETPPCLLAGL
ncbi:hypothetical protein Z043_102740 [Scleropages formosus]|uniref:Glypican-5-like n=1 Tax=Scleropages formosus TaxID=113540 RepID=A0A0P7VUJ5_SCLFO|nr:hypothetical protein Z043_102740 [Scleropages formosus]